MTSTTRKESATAKRWMEMTTAGHSIYKKKKFRRRPICKSKKKTCFCKAAFFV